MQKTASIKTNFIFNCLLTISNIIFPIITFPYVSRILGPEGTGKVEFVTSIVYYFNMFAQLGIPTYGIRQCANQRDNKDNLSLVVKELLLLNFIMSLLSYFGLFISILIVPRFAEEKDLLFIISSNILLSCIGIEWLYKGLELYSYITIRSVVFKLIALIAMFSFIHSKSDYKIYGAITILASSASYILNFIKSREIIDYKNRNNLDLKRHMKPVLVFFAMSIATTVYTHLDTVMLGMIKTDLDVGLYNAAIKIRKLLLGFVTSLGTVLLPRASYYVKNHLMDSFYKVTIKSFEFVIILALSVSIYFMLFTREGILFLSGSEFEGSIIPMKVIMPTVFLVGLTNISGIQMLVPLGEEKIVLYSEIAGAFADLIINIILIPQLSTIGAAIGTLIAEITVLTVQFTYLRNIILKLFKQIKWTVIIKSLFVSAVASLIFKAYSVSSVFLTLVFSSILFFGLYLLLLNVYKEPLVIEIEKELIAKINKKFKF